jgi:cytidylate kinase
MIIAIDGPAASGKGTLARRLAAHYGLRHLDTGLTYRAVAASMLADGAALDDEAAAVAAAERLDLSALDRVRLADHAVGEAASRVAVMPALRAALVRAQRAFAEVPPGAVLDGRDVGTVICPDAPVKLYVTADVETRAHRRVAELAARGEPVEPAAILADLARRDARDAGRAASPMRPAADAILVDTSGMTADEAFAVACGIVERIRAG